MSDIPHLLNTLSIRADEWWQKYGTTRNAPVDLVFPTYPDDVPPRGKTVRAREAKSKQIFEKRQRVNLRGFTARELVDLDVVSSRKLKAPNLTNQNLPSMTLDRWESHRDPRHALDLFPIDIDELDLEGTWVANDDLVRPSLEPILQLATRMLLNASMTPWLIKTLDHKFAFFAGSINHITCESTSSKSTAETTLHKYFMDDEVMWTFFNIDTFEALLNPDLTDAERLGVQWFFATVLHAINGALDWKKTQYGAEPYYEDDPLAECGYAMERAVGTFGMGVLHGRNIRIGSRTRPSLTLFDDDDPSLPLIETIKLVFPPAGGLSISPDPPLQSDLLAMKPAEREAAIYGRKLLLSDKAGRSFWRKMEGMSENVTAIIAEISKKQNNDLSALKVQQQYLVDALIQHEGAIRSLLDLERIDSLTYRERRVHLLEWNAGMRLFTRKLGRRLERFGGAIERPDAEPKYLKYCLMKLATPDDSETGLLEQDRTELIELERERAYLEANPEAAKAQCIWETWEGYLRDPKSEGSLMLV
ncbi:hypothetical protein G7Y89_g2330 [Cudoniella acicularis]|uniref:Uncharacterized protein n=1 Tax=Cudoniella acicularis TaxID=354080 RepID=A0A8H4RTI5_9HELO|nr:hypothetical protein G7Y89_g2330 [Cudoniella acicularis]